ncbi:MAG: BMC domain-containing protein [Gammaproteobacteria bacterium]|nr:BMC domain-containing protein [Gammaproteobacteria bacterium]MDH3372386.1 BMC domain-containing protein [Gammaproteobacteria bacterium]MDH3551059.1 BMC domain-containing protein [Gammaproteobacteria bacterium]
MAQNKKRHGALALLEFENVADGIRASDLMVKRAPIALLRCGSVHPGRFLVLVGGSVASTEEAYFVGVKRGESAGTLSGSVFLGDVHPSLHDAVLGTRREPAGDALAVFETRSSPALLAAVDAAVKSTPVMLSEIRLGDDLGGHALALMSGDLTDAETALGICTDRAGDQLLAQSLLPRLDNDLRRLLGQGTRFGPCSPFEPSGAEYPEEIACSWDG